jgi:AcrR family transcriptional regulator
MKLNEEVKTEKKQLILEASQACFIRKGFHNTTMQDICREAQMSAGNIYRYFDSKEMIIEAFAEEELRWMTTAITDVPSSPDMLQAIVDTAFWTAATLMQDGRSELMAELFAEAGRNPRINAIYTRFNKQLTDEIHGALEELEANKLLCPLHDKQSIARIIVSLVDGLVLNKIISPNFDIMALRPAIETMVTSLFVEIEPVVQVRSAPKCS